MQNFADQCLDLARTILGQNLQAINEDGTVQPVKGEASRSDEPGHAALAIGEFFRATHQTELAGHDLVDLSARCITAQTFCEHPQENGLAFASLGLVSFGPSKERNDVWQRLMEETQERLQKLLNANQEYANHLQSFNIAKSVARFSMDLSKKDDTGQLIDDFIKHINDSSSNGFCDDSSDGTSGAFDLYGIMSFVLVRQALQLHANIHLRDRKLPSLRTYAEKYLKMIPEMVRNDGLGWAYGRGIGAYGQMHCISMILQALRDGWVTETQKPLYLDTLRKLFQYFFTTYIDQEHGVLVIRDGERDAFERHTTRMANLDAARYLCQWSRLAASIGGSLASAPLPPAKTYSRFITFDKGHRKEQGCFIYHDAASELHFQLPLVSPGQYTTSDSLAFPHAPGIFDWPVNKYLPIMLPELTFGDDVVIPSFYGKNCVTGLGLRRSYYFRYDQPELINTEGKMISGLGACKVNWSFSGSQITSEFTFVVQKPVQLDSMRYVLALSAPHSTLHCPGTYTLGAESLRAAVVKDDFQAEWDEPEQVSNSADYRTYYGKIHYLQTLKRKRPLQMRPGQQYRLSITFKPDITKAG